MGRKQKKAEDRATKGVLIRMEPEILKAARIIVKREGKKQGEGLNWLITEGMKAHQHNNQTKIPSYAEGGIKSERQIFNQLREDIGSLAQFKDGANYISTRIIRKNLVKNNFSFAKINELQLQLIEAARIKGLLIEG